MEPIMVGKRRAIEEGLHQGLSIASKIEKLK
jgi:hypothetical protein